MEYEANAENSMRENERLTRINFQKLMELDDMQTECSEKESMLGDEISELHSQVEIYRRSSFVGGRSGQL